MPTILYLHALKQPRYLRFNSSFLSCSKSNFWYIQIIKLLDLKSEILLRLIHLLHTQYRIKASSQTLLCRNSTRTLSFALSIKDSTYGTKCMRAAFLSIAYLHRRLIPPIPKRYSELNLSHNCIGCDRGGISYWCRWLKCIYTISTRPKP